MALALLVLESILCLCSGAPDALALYGNERLLVSSGTDLCPLAPSEPHDPVLLLKHFVLELQSPRRSVSGAKAQCSGSAVQGPLE